MPEGFFTLDSISLGVAYCIAVLILLILLIVQAKNTYDDLFTKERKSIRPRTSMPPKINSSYKIANFCTLGCIYFYIQQCIVNGSRNILRNAQFGGYRSCSALWPYYFWQSVGSAIGMIFAKLCMYLTLLARLHLSYYRSPVSFSEKTLKSWAVFLCIYTIGLTTLSCFLITKDSFCSTERLEPAEPYFSIYAVSYIIYEIGTAVGFTLSYILPLRKLLKLLDENGNKNEAATAHDDDADDMTTGTMYYLAVKTTTLEVVQTASSLLYMIVVFIMIAATDDAAINLASIDAVINSVCLVLMSNYYEDVKYYQRLCWLCIKCCSPTSEAYRAKIRHVPENTAEVEIPDMTAAKTTSAALEETAPV